MRHYKIIDAFENDEYSHRLYSCLREDFKHYDDDAVCVAGYTVDWVCDEDGVPDYDQEPKWYFWKAGWEDELELEWFDDKDAAYERLEQYMAELEREAVALESAIETIELEHHDDFTEFRKWARKNGLTDGSYSQTMDLAITWSEEDKTMTPDEIFKGLNKRVLAYNNKETEKILDTLD